MGVLKYWYCMFNLRPEKYIFDLKSGYVPQRCLQFENLTLFHLLLLDIYLCTNNSVGIHTYFFLIYLLLCVWVWEHVPWGSLHVALVVQHAAYAVKHVLHAETQLQPALCML